MRTRLVWLVRLALNLAVIAAAAFSLPALWNGVLAPMGAPDWTGWVLFASVLLAYIVFINWAERKLSGRRPLTPLKLRPLPKDIFRRTPQKFLLDDPAHRSEAPPATPAETKMGALRPPFP